MISALLVALLAANSPAGAADDGRPEAVASAAGLVEVIVEPASPVPASADLGTASIPDGAPAELAPILAEAGAGSRVTRIGVDGDWVAMEVPADRVDDLAASGAVRSVSESPTLYPALADTVPLVGADDTAAVGWDGSGRTIAIVDTGVDASHPALAGRVVAEACFTVDAACPGFSDAPGSGAPCTGSSQCAHGTHVAGVAAGGGAGVVGVAPDARIVSVRIFRAISPTQVSAPNSALLAALEWLRDERANLSLDVVNLSLGGEAGYGECDLIQQPLADVISELRAAGVATVAASGNQGLSGQVNLPGCISSAVTVAATTDGDQVASFSNLADLVDLAGPGVEVVSAAPSGGLASSSGTSVSAPHVSGAFAVLREASPTLSVSAIEARLADTGRLVSRDGIGVPRIDVGSAVLGAAPVSATAGDRRATVRWAGSPVAGGVVTGYRITVEPGGTVIERPASERSFTVTGLTNGLLHRFTVAPRFGASIGGAVTTNFVLPKPPAPPHGFVDVDTSAFYEAGVRWAAAEGVTTGVGGSDRFVPDGEVTRAEMATFLWRTVDEPGGFPPHGFVDVPPSTFYESALRWAKATGVTTGVGGSDRFVPDGVVTRAEMVTFLWRMVGTPGVGIAHGFVDVPPSTFYEPALRWAAFHGITTGVGGSTRFEPDRPVTRGEAVTFLRRVAATPDAWPVGAVYPSTIVF